MKKKTKKQIELLKNKASLGDPSSLHELAFYHQAGMYVEQDYNKALQLWKKAANKGFGPAYHNLVSIYYNGLGVRPNIRKAYKYLLLSIKKKHHLRAESLGFLAQKFYFDGLLGKKNVKMGLKYHKQAAKENYLPSQFNIAAMYDKEFDLEPGVKKNNKIAFYYHKMAAKNNFVPSIFRVAMEYLHGDIVKKNPKEALKLFKKGLKIRNLDMLRSLGYKNAEVGSNIINTWKSSIRKELKKSGLII